METKTERETLHGTAAEAARKRFEAYLDEKLCDAYDFEAWEFYTFLLEKAKSREVDRSGYLSEEYRKDRDVAAKNREVNMVRRKAFYLVTASKCDYDEYDSMVVVACNEAQAVKSALEEGDCDADGLHYPHFDEAQGPFSAERLNPFNYQIGDKPVASFNAG